MILTRQGNKTRIAKIINSYFPPHKTYIELFFGAGGMFFNKPTASNNICNDYNGDVFNLWVQVKENKNELVYEITQLPIHQDLWKYYKKKQYDNPVIRAAIFLMYSNFGYMGKPDSLGVAASQNYKASILDKMDETLNKLSNVIFMNEDFRNVLPKIKYRSYNEKTNALIYSDPPYLDTFNYKMKWSKQDTLDCMDITFNSDIKAVMSEFNHKFILEEASRRKLNVITLGERQNMKNIRTEILITNFKPKNKLF